MHQLQTPVVSVPSPKEEYGASKECNEVHILSSAELPAHNHHLMVQRRKIS